jgi:hypothetical protein
VCVEDGASPVTVKVVAVLVPTCVVPSRMR